ncbi:MAG: hypothetical protein DCC58_12600 [Chloroflexi bacterium]|nr:MAG: hypothetical protein DCC58_12600 [Chloroflexota bacterium]
MVSMSHAEQHRDYPRGTPVIAADGELLGTIDVVHPHFFLVRDDAQRHLDLQVPVHAIGSYDGERLYLTVNREALSSVDDEESVARRLHESEMDED